MEPEGTSSSFGDDFGQRIDLCVRIREIIRAYPEGTAVLKELVRDTTIDPPPSQHDYSTRGCHFHKAPRLTILFYADLYI